jgi:tRNA nucleotidyltransferase (CCA-adding enzyme)
MKSIPENVSCVTELLVKNKYEAFLVGGCVRDIIMGRVPNDYDITTNATPQQIIAAFEPTGLRIVYENKFGTVSIVFEDEPHESNVREIQITPYRIEGTYSDNRHPDEIRFSETINDDLSRRDFTINALALKPSPCSGEGDMQSILGENMTNTTPPRTSAPLLNKEGKSFDESIIDLYNGQNDIETKTIRTVGDATERFSEDALRIMRAVRFAAQLHFAISSETLAGIEQTKHLLANISIERIRDEFIKIIDSDHPGYGMFLMKQLGLLEYVLPEIIPSIGCEQGGVHIYDVFDHLVHACQHAADKKFIFHIKLAALFHDIGKPKTRRPGTKKAYTFYGHEVVGARITERAMKRMKFSNDDIQIVTTFVRWHMFFSDTETITLSPVRRMIANVAGLAENPLLFRRGGDVGAGVVCETNESKDQYPSASSYLLNSSPKQGSMPFDGPTPVTHPIWLLMQVRECDRVGMNKVEASYRLRKYFAMIEDCLRDPISVKQLKIDGNYLMKDLGLKPGPRMGWMLHAMLQEVIEDPEKNTTDYLTDRVTYYETLSDDELRNLGLQGKEIKEQTDNELVKQLHVKHGVHRKRKP